MHRFGSALVAELSKATTLPAIGAATGGTVGAGAVVVWLLATVHPHRSADEYLLASVGFLEVGMAVLGIAAAAQDCGPGHFRTALLAVPRRNCLLMAKTLSFAVVCSVVAVLAVASCAGMAWSQAGARDLGSNPIAWGRLTTVVLVLVAIGALSFGVTLLTRSGTAALVVMLGLIALLPTVLSSYPAVSQWLPTEVGLRIYAGAPEGQATMRAYFALGAWVTVGVGLGWWRFGRSEG